ncbi:methyltransferase family protein [Streptomyces sp. NPDC087658]|uniref:methyltransferase family protein n=1 Tax=Streptomyces sp. NPDC087658 TaxID=3365800 RepID=UPI003827F09D
MGTLRLALGALIGVCFLIFVVAWIAGAVHFRVKNHPSRADRERGLRRTLLLVVGVCAVSVLIRYFLRSFWRHLQYWQPELALLGAALAVASTALLLWARWHLGTMWSSAPMVQEHHELRTDGPYGIVRHPIYSGFLGLITGAMLADGFGVWIAVLVVTIPWLLYRVHVEDGLMAGRFGAAYDTYRARVPALIPWPRTSAARAGHHHARGKRHT